MATVGAHYLVETPGRHAGPGAPGLHGAVTPIVRTLAALLLVGCATAADGLRPLQDSALAQALVGAWCNSDDGGRTCWAYDVFSADGHLRACGRFPDESRPFDGTGVVSISGQVMCYRVVRASETFWVRPGSTYCTRILGVARDRHVYQDLETGATASLSRVPAAAVACAPEARP